MRRRVGRFLSITPLVAIGVVLLATMSVAADTPENKRTLEPALHDYLSANGLLNRGLYDLATAEYRKFLSKHAGHDKAPLAHYGLGVCLFRTKQYEAATEQLAPLHKKSKFEFAAEVGTMLGQCHLIGKYHARAAKVFNKIVKRHSDHNLAGDAAAGLAEALYLDGNYKAAVKVCERYEDGAYGDRLLERVYFFHGLSLMARNNFADAAQRFDELLERFAKGPFADQSSLLLAQCYQHADATEKAIGQYRKIVERETSRYHRDGLLGLGTLLQQQGEHEEAGTFLDQLLKQSPEKSMLAKAQFQRGLAWFDQNEFERAFEILQSVAADSGDLGDRASYWMGKCKLRSGDPRQAAKRLGDAIERFPDSSLIAEMIYDRAIALVRDDRLEAATGVLETFRSRFPDHALTADALQLLASVEHQRLNFDNSLTFCREFIERFSTHELASSVSFVLAENQFLADQIDESVESYRSFLSQFPDNPQVGRAKFRLGTALYRLDRFDPAVAFLTEAANAAQEEPHFQSAWLALGDIYFQRNEWSDARRCLSEYLSNGSDVPSADDALLKLGLSHQRQEQLEPAIEAYDRLIDQFQQSTHHNQAVFERGQALVALDRLDEAVTAFEAVLAVDAKSRFAPYALNHLAAIATQRKDFAAASRLFDRTAQVAKAGDMQTDAMFQEAQALMSARQFGAAHTAYDEFLSDNGSSAHAPVARAQRAIALARQDQYADAVKAIEALNGADLAKLDAALRSAVHYEKAWCLRELGRDDEATQTYRTLLDLAPEGNISVHALVELSGIEINAERFEQAAELLRRFMDIIESNPDSVSNELREQATYRLGVAAFELGQLQEAADEFESFAEHFPDSSLAASAAFYGGEACFLLNRHEQAVKHLVRVAEDFKDDPVYGPSLLRLGESLGALQRWARSERVFTLYVEQFSDAEHWYQAQFGMGWARENQKRHEEAISAYRAVTARHTGATAARAQFQIGECLFAKNKYDQAVREFLKVDILYAYPEWSAAALYEAAQCFQKLGKVVESRAHYKLVLDKHKDTRWAELASQRISETAATGLPGR